jgi:hypothetical protein
VVMIVVEILFVVGRADEEITAIHFFLHLAHVFGAHGEIGVGFDGGRWEKCLC